MGALWETTHLQITLLEWSLIKDPRNHNIGVIWVVVKMMVPFWVLSTIRYLVLRGPKLNPKALRPRMLRLLGPKTMLYKAFGLF